MATFHLSTRAQSRNLYGHKVNSLSHFQYITRSDRYTNKDEDLAYSESGNIPNCPELELDIKNYWKAANDYGRVNSRAYRDVVIALQEEFSLDENIAMVHDFMHHFGIDENQTYSFAIHDHQSKLAPEHRNIHCHLMFNERIVNQERVFTHAEDIFKRANSPVSGGLKIDRYFSRRDFVIDAREYWEKINNEMFIKKGLHARISCKTLKEQKAELEAEGRYEEAKYYDRKPMDHMGPEFKDPKVLQEIYERSLEKEKELNIKDEENHEEITIQAEKVYPVPEDDYETMEEYVEEQNDTSDIPPEAYDPSGVLPESEEEYVNENAQTVENHMNGSFEVPQKEKNPTIPPEELTHQVENAPAPDLPPEWEEPTPEELSQQTENEMPEDFPTDYPMPEEDPGNDDAPSYESESEPRETNVQEPEPPEEFYMEQENDPTENIPENKEASPAEIPLELENEFIESQNTINKETSDLPPEYFEQQAPMPEEEPATVDLTNDRQADADLAVEYESYDNEEDNMSPDEADAMINDYMASQDSNQEEQEEPAEHTWTSRFNDPWAAMRQAEQAEADAFETKKEMYATDLALRRVAKEYQLEKAKLNQKRYQRKLYQLKKFGFDETIATDPITVTVGDLTRYMEKIEARYDTKIQKEVSKAIAYREAKLENPAQILAYKWKRFEEILAKNNESGSMVGKRDFTTYQKYKKLKAEIANLKAKEKAANANDLAGIQRECISKERDLKLIETERLYFSIQTENGKTDVDVKLSEIEQSKAFHVLDQEVKKHNQAREKWAREAERKAEQLSKTQQIYRVQREKLEKSMPESMLLYGEDIPSKVYLTAKVRGKPLMQMPFTNINNDVYVIVKPPKEMAYGKPVTMACVKLGEATSRGMARIYKVNIIVTQERIGASGKVIPKYTALSAASTNLGARLYPKYNPLLENGTNLTPLDLSAGSGGHQKIPPRARAIMRTQSKLEELVSKTAQNDTRSFGHIWDQEQTADAKTAQAKRNDPTKEMAAVNNELENGEWSEMMRQLYEASGIDISRGQGRSR